MSLQFSDIKNSGILGLDDQLDFGKHIGYTVLEVIKDRPQYIEWLIKEGKKFYPSVHEEIKRNKIDKIYKKVKHYYCGGDLQGDMAHFEASHQEWDDVPF